MAKVYVGTYKKYNEGSLSGAWLDLADYPTYTDFLKACRNVHKNERDPEFMIQDTDGFPDGLSCMEWMSEQDFNDVKQAMKEDGIDLKVIDYSEKAIAVVGDTKAFKEQLKQMGGRFNGKLSCGAGWIFSKKQREAVEKFINSGNTPVQCDSEGKQFTEWLKEYAVTGDSYYVKHSVGAVKLHDAYYLLDKPSMNNRFCFHDEGPQYEYYKELMADKETRLAAYFKDNNLGVFDRKIESIEKGNKVYWRKGSDDYEKHIYLGFDWRYKDNTDVECTEDETKIILNGLKWARGMFEKRLDAYLKRYGTSKIHTWTYWADA